MPGLRDLPNIGPVIAAKLAQVGIDTPEELAAVGAKGALIRIRAALDPGACVRELCALEGAIRGIKDTALPDDVKSDLRAFHRGLS